MGENDQTRDHAVPASWVVVALAYVDTSGRVRVEQREYRPESHAILPMLVKDFEGSIRRAGGVPCDMFLTHVVLPRQENPKGDPSHESPDSEKPG